MASWSLIVQILHKDVLHGGLLLFCGRHLLYKAEEGVSYG